MQRRFKKKHQDKGKIKKVYRLLSPMTQCEMMNSNVEPVDSLHFHIVEFRRQWLPGKGNHSVSMLGIRLKHLLKIKRD